MAAQADSSALDPEVVGNAFVEQYYSILHQSPDLVYRFYQESSMVSRPNSSGAMTMVTTMNGINEQILSMNYQNYKVQIYSADAQLSYNNGVIVLVTGCLIANDNLRRKFTQSFFLAPQDKGFFVLNDVFRYLEENDQKEEAVEVAIDDIDESAPTAPLTPDPEPTEIPIQPVDDKAPVKEETESKKEVSISSENGTVPAAENRSVAVDPVVSVQGVAPPVAETVTPKTQEEAPKKSFASVVHALNKSNAPFNVVTRVPPVKRVEQPRSTVLPEASAPKADIASEKNNDNAGKGHSIFIGNLPNSATPEELKEIFEKFGPIKPDGVQVRSQKQTGNCFGFVEFESASSVQSVLKVSPIMIGNRRASIEVKRGSSNGGRFSGRDSNFRGRGNFNEGRGYRRNDYEKRGEFTGRAWGNRGSDEANHKGNQNGGKVSRQGQSQSGLK